MQLYTNGAFYSMAKVTSKRELSCSRRLSALNWTIGGVRMHQKFLQKSIRTITKRKMLRPWRMMMKIRNERAMDWLFSASANILLSLLIFYFRILLNMHYNYVNKVILKWKTQKTQMCDNRLRINFYLIFCRLTFRWFLVDCQPIVSRLTAEC